MQLFAHNDEVDSLERQLGAAEVSQRVLALIPLAWQLRQRDPQRALTLAAEAEKMLQSSGMSEVECSRFTARLQLLQSEIAWLRGELEQAEQFVKKAQIGFLALDDFVGIGDAHWLNAYLVIDRGNTRQSVEEILSALQAYRTAGDTQRVQMAIARNVAIHAFIDTAFAKSLLDLTGQSGEPDNDPAVCTWFDYAIGVLTQSASDLVKSAHHYQRAYFAALLTGQTRQAVIAAGNLSNSLVEFNNPTTALEWSERGLVLARATGLPTATGILLLRTGSVLAQLDHLDLAQAHLNEALRLLTPIKESRSYAMVLREMGEVCLALKQDVKALEWFKQAQARCNSLGAKEILAEALRGRAQALRRLGRPQEALNFAHEGLALCLEYGYRVIQIVLLQIIADLHRHYSLTMPDGQSHSTATLDYLNQALQIAAGMDGYTVPSTLLEETAAEHAKLGDFGLAYQLALQAGISRVHFQSKDAINRALAMQVRYETDRNQAEVMHHKQLAAEEAKRADALLNANATLEELGKIGLEITGSLEAHAVITAISHHVNKLLDATTFGILLLNADGDTLVTVFNTEAGQELPEERYKLDDQNSNLARCAREQTEITFSLEPGMVPTTQIPGTMVTLSAMYAPFVFGGRLLGAMTIQSPASMAYGEREVAIFRTLCAYGAIAIANGQSFEIAKQARQSAEQAQAQTASLLEELRAAQALLIEQNKALEQLSMTDSLTGLANRMRLDAALEQELARRERQGGLLSLVMIDIDNFKNINDTHGHQAGDVVLIEVARVLKSNIRKTDVLGRWGGEEFLLISNDTNEQATALAEKLRKALQGHDISLAGRITASFGLSTYRPGDNMQSLISRADSALYRAKETGRNRVEG